MFTLYFVIFGIVIALFGSMIGYKIQMINVQERIDQNAKEVAFNKKINTLEPSIDGMESMVIALATNKTIQEYIQEPNYQHKNDMINLFYAIAMSDNLVMQARYIDAEGKEKIRVDRLNESSIPFVVEDEKLQDKSSRDYFKIVSKMAPEKIWHSKLDLNIENGKIEVPFRPTIRIATPIYNKDKFVGIVIINMLTNKLLNSLRTSPVFEHYIIDKEGNFILNPNDKLSWSKYAKSPARLIDDFPTEASNILAGARKGENFYAYTLDDVLHNDDDAILILKPKADYKHSLILSNIESAAVVILLSILLSIPLALYASIIPSRLQKDLWLSNNELKKISTMDQLTGVFNRRQLDQCIHHEVEKASRYSRPLSMLMIDIDHFKKVNDTYGHQIGDYALISISRILSQHIRSSDILGRFGGEEFVILCPESDKDEAAELGEKLRQTIEEYSFDTIGNLTISIGISEFKAEMSNEDLLYKADIALYKAKNGGRNQVVAEG